MSGRCAACDAIMNDFEMTRKSATTGEYIDLCSKCLDPIIDEFVLIEREDLRVNEVAHIEDSYTEINIGEEDD